MCKEQKFRKELAVMTREELTARAKKYIEDYDKANGITVPMVNIPEVVEQLVSFWDASEAEYELWAKKTLSLQLKEGTKGYEKMKQELIDYWKATPVTAAPILRTVPDENGNRKGFVSNLDERWFRKPADWKTRIKLAQRMK